MPKRKPKLPPIGLTDFKRVIEDEYAYVDKSLLIQELLNTAGLVHLIPRPRRFGKTLNMSMLRYFFEKSEPSNAHLFKGLAISKHADAMQHQGKYPVIFMTFKEVKASTWDDAFRAFKAIIQCELERHLYLQKSTKLAPSERQRFQDLISMVRPGP